jgi:hypothetical protein
MKSEKYERGGMLKFKIHVLRQMKFGTVKDYGHTHNFYLNR